MLHMSAAEALAAQQFKAEGRPHLQAVLPLSLQDPAEAWGVQQYQVKQ